MLVFSVEITIPLLGVTIYGLLNSQYSRPLCHVFNCNLFESQHYVVFACTKCIDYIIVFKNHLKLHHVLYNDFLKTIFRVLPMGLIISFDRDTYF